MPAPPNKHRLNNFYIKNLKPREQPYCAWDTYQKGLAVLVQPSGSKAYHVVYRFGGRSRWYFLGHVDAIGLDDARKLASRAMFAVAEGKDPAAEKKAERGKGSFDELYERYLNEHAKRHNKSWAHADKLMRKHALPRWGKMPAGSISRADVKSLQAKLADTPSQANAVIAHVGAVFSWAMEWDLLPANPCTKVSKFDTDKRMRVMSDTEIPLFWRSFDDRGLMRSTCLKMLLLLGQRSIEVEHMRYEHIRDGWWTLPGKPVKELNWPGTKSKQSHRVWLPKAAQALLRELDDTNPKTGPVFTRVSRLSDDMQAICGKLGITDRVRPHDFRRTHGSTITRLGFGRDAMNRIQNHADAGVASVYDQYEYSDEDRRIMETVAKKILSLVSSTPDNVLEMKRKA